METKKEDLLSLKKGEWIKINPLRDIKHIKKLTYSLKKQSEEFVFNDDNTHFFRRSLDPFDNKHEQGYRVETKTQGRTSWSELYFENKLIAIK